MLFYNKSKVFQTIIHTWHQNNENNPKNLLSWLLTTLITPSWKALCRHTISMFRYFRANIFKTLCLRWKFFALTLNFLNYIFFFTYEFLKTRYSGSSFITNKDANFKNLQKKNSGSTLSQEINFRNLSSTSKLDWLLERYETIEIPIVFISCKFVHNCQCSSNISYHN